MTGPAQTSHEPTPSELSRTEGHEQHRPGDLPGEAHGADDHGGDHGHDDHAHAGEALGPVDATRWGAFIVGIGAGLLVALCLVLTIAVIGSSPVV
jgi:hypothetical protein